MADYRFRPITGDMVFERGRSCRRCFPV